MRDKDPRRLRPQALGLGLRRIHEFGGLDVLQWTNVPEPKARPGQVVIKVDSSGVNYADIMRRQGNYPGPDLPSTLGIESAGTICEAGASDWNKRPPW